MLALTDRVAEVIRQAVLASGLPEGAGLRITVERESAEGSTTFGAMLAGTAEPADKILIFGADVRVFLDPAASPKLDDKLLDVEVEPTRVVFGVTEQQGSDRDG